MYLSVLRLISGTGILLAFWPVFGILGVTAFDCITPVIILCSLPYKPAIRGAPLQSFSLAIAGLILLTFAGVVSVVSSSEPLEHLLKVLDLVLALGGVVALAYVLENRKIISRVQMLVLMLISATMNSLVCILQGRFGILTGIIADARNGVHSWTRMTGLSGHAIEAGYVAAFGMCIGIGLALHTRRVLVFGTFSVICAYSMTYSASLTGLFAAVIGMTSLLLFCKAYKSLLASLLVAIFALGAVFTSNGLGLLTNRLMNLGENMGNYDTLNKREVQLSKAVESIEPSTLMVGNGYSNSDLPYGMEIHNGLIASLFHFGLLGLLGQVLLISYFTNKLFRNDSPTIKATLLACVLIFMCGYLTGPGLSRRSVWVPVLIIGGYLSGERRRVQNDTALVAN